MGARTASRCAHSLSRVSVFTPSLVRCLNNVKAVQTRVSNSLGGLKPSHSVASPRLRWSVVWAESKLWNWLVLGQGAREESQDTPNLTPRPKSLSTSPPASEPLSFSSSASLSGRHHHPQFALPAPWQLHLQSHPSPRQRCENRPMSPLRPPFLQEGPPHLATGGTASASVENNEFLLAGWSRRRARGDQGHRLSQEHLYHPTCPNLQANATDLRSRSHAQHASAFAHCHPWWPPSSLSESGSVTSWAIHRTSCATSLSCPKQQGHLQQPTSAQRNRQPRGDACFSEKL